MVSAFLSLAEELIEQEKQQELEQKKMEENQFEEGEEEKDVSIPLSTHNYGFNQ